MSRADLNSEWAWTQVEAMADGSLRGASRSRMQQAMRLDPKLHAAVGRARFLRRGLQRSTLPSIPGSLLKRLLDIPGGSSIGLHWFASPAKAATSLAVAATIVALAATLATLRPAGPEAADPRIVALQEFELAMKYLQKSAAITGEEVGGAVSDGLREALIVSRDSIRETQQEHGG